MKRAEEGECCGMGGTITIQPVSEPTRIKWDVEYAYGIMKQRPNENNKNSFLKYIPQPF